jgi:signal transduction histidine kinase
MKSRPRVPLFVVSLALLGLIGLLATLQYRWLGRISEAERDRMRATLNSGASAFARDFDAELTLGYLLFQTDPLGETEDLPTRFAARVDRWHATSKYPRLIRNFYTFVPGEHARPDTLERFDPATRTFAAVEWPASMPDWRAHVTDGTTEQTSTSRDGGTFFIRRMASPIWDTVPAIVVPSPLLLVRDAPGDTAVRVAPRLSYTILELDEDYISREMLPALAEQHFTRASGATFQVAVVSRTRGGRVLYHSNDAFNPAPDTHADATADLFSVRTQDFSRVASEVHRFTTFAAALRPRTRSPKRPGQTEPATDKRQVSIVVGRDGSRGQRAPLPGQALTSASTLTKATTTPPSWQLILTHQSGSLEAAVDTVRRRNLIVSSSILGVLGASMGLLILATRRAQQLAQQQMEFVATVSHELRTPLAVIRSAAENLADGIVEDEAQVRKYGELVRGEGRRLTDMVEQILEFSGIQSGERRMNAIPVPIGPLIQGVVDASASLTGATGIEVEVSLPDDLPPVLGDEPALGRVFQNLFANAIKYGAGGGWIGVEARRQGGDVLVTIADRGIGIDPSDQPRVFEPFYRAAAVVEAQIQGAGLGLSLVQRIVQAHGGTVTVRSAPGAGAAFTVQLPVATSERRRATRTTGGARHVTSAAARSGTKAPRYS